VCSSSDHLCCVILQEAIVIPPWVALAIRPRPGVWEYVRVNVSELAVEELRVPEYLQFKEQLVEEGYKFAPKLIMIDFLRKISDHKKLGLVVLRKKFQIIYDSL